jgi:predicted nuclease of predicted toxin-antitoxin system
VIWSFAARNGFALVSKDADFTHRALLRGHPPKVIYLWAAHSSTARIRQLLDDHRPAIQDFLGDPVASLLTLE